MNIQAPKITVLQPEDGMGSQFKPLDSKSLKGPNFAQMMLDKVNDVNTSIVQSEKMSEEHLTQGKHELHEVLIAMDQADLKFRFITQVRSKILDAYTEVMRMQV